MNPIRSAARALTSAFRLLTVVPLPAPPDGDDPHPLTSACFPLVGLALGGALAVCALLPLPASARAALILVVWTGLTGGLHEDGWADTMDAILAPVDRSERLRILKDPRVGAQGLTATVLLLLLRFGALTALPAAAIMVPPVIGRWAMAVSLSATPPLADGGLGARYGRRAPSVGPTVTALLALLVLAAAGSAPLTILLAWSAGGIGAWTMARILVRRLGGVNGDGHGATGLAAETVALWALLPAI